MIIGSKGRQLKVYHGVSYAHSLVIHECPSAVVRFHSLTGNVAVVYDIALFKLLKLYRGLSQRPEIRFALSRVK